MTCTATPTSRLLEPIPGLPPDDVIFGKSVAMAKIRRKLEKAAGANIAVLLRGQSGAGEEVFAKLIHSQSPWRDGIEVRFVCATNRSLERGMKSGNFRKDFFNGTISLKQAVRAATKHIVRTFILKALETHQWNRRKAAEALDIQLRRATLQDARSGHAPDPGSESFARERKRIRAGGECWMGYVL